MTDSTEIQIRFLEPGATNKQFEQNLRFFEQSNPTMAQRIKGHNCRRYRPCLNPDDSLNLFDSDQKQLVYPADKAGIATYFEAAFACIHIGIDRHNDFLEGHRRAAYRHAYAPLHSAFQKQLYALSHLPSLVDPASGAFTIPSERVSFLPLLRVYGIGLGHHIIQAINRYDINCLLIHEPEFDLFYCSLFTLPWDQLISHFSNDPNRHFQLNLLEQGASLENEWQLITHLHPFFYCGRASLEGFFNRDFQAYQDAVFQLDYRLYTAKATGFYDDQVVGLKHALANIRAGNAFYNGKRLAKKYTVFLVGSGPSLTDALPFIKDNRDQALVIACGSSISLLVKNGVFPDYHILQERPDSVERLHEYTDASAYLNISCIKLNVVHPALDDLYRETLVLQKTNDPGSSLLPSERYPHSKNVNPTVTNTGLTLCKFIGARRVYLFGIDYGAPQDELKNHAEGIAVFSWADRKTPVQHKDDNVAIEDSVRMDGNFGTNVYGNIYFYWSRDIANLTLLEDDARGIDWINVGDGAKLANTTPMLAADLKPLTGKPLDKSAARKAIRGLFDDDYSQAAVSNTLIDVHLPASKDYIVAMMEAFQTIPENRNIMMTVLALISEAANVGADEEDYLPRSLFGVEFQSFLNALYVQVCSTRSDQEASQLYANAIPVLQAHMQRVFEHFAALCDDSSEVARSHHTG
jgi:hypothetical protein